MFFTQKRFCNEYFRKTFPLNQLQKAKFSLSVFRIFPVLIFGFVTSEFRWHFMQASPSFLSAELYLCDEMALSDSVPYPSYEESQSFPHNPLHLLIVLDEGQVATTNIEFHHGELGVTLT